METRHLRAWSLRAVALAWPSAALALMGTQSPESLLAMAAGIATFVLLFAHLSSRLETHDTYRRWWSALEKAAWVKAALLFVALPAWGLVLLAHLRPSFLFPFFAAVALDWATGALGLSLATLLYESTGVPRTSLENSFTQTLLVTLLQGTFITLSLIPITVAILRWQTHHRNQAFRGPFG